MKILVVDDDPTAREILARLLARYGAVDDRADGREAVAACVAALDNAAPYDLVCMDIMMPVMSGLEALNAIRQEEVRRGRRPPDGAKVIMTSCCGDDKSISTAFRGLCDAYLVKPLDGAQLLNILYCLFPMEE